MSMRWCLIGCWVLLACEGFVWAAEPPASAAADAPARFIQPGETRRDVPAKKVRGELLSYDPATRTGSFKSSADGSVQSFYALPHVVCHHHGAAGDMSDYRIGERLRFVLHQSSGGEWNLLGLVSEELHENVLHDEPYFVDQIDAQRGILTCTRRNRAGDKIVWPGMVIHTGPQTRYWREGKPNGSFQEISAGMPLWIKTHGGSGLLERHAWEVLLDDASVEHLKREQIAAHFKRLDSEGLPGYVDSARGNELRLTLFPETMGYILNRTPADSPSGDSRGLRLKQPVQVALAGPDRVAKGDRLPGRIAGLRPYIRQGNYICEATVVLDAAVPAEFKPAQIARLWPVAASPAAASPVKPAE